MKIIQTILQKWYLLVGFALFAVLLGVITEETRYVSNASVMFKIGREHLYKPEFGNRQPIVSTRTDLGNAINTESHIMGSSDVLQAAVIEVGAAKILSETLSASAPDQNLLNQNAMDLLSRELSIRAIDGTSVLHLTFTHEDPVVAQSTVKAILEAFLEQRKKLYGDSSLELMEKKLKENQTLLRVAEEDLQKFSTTHRIYAYKDQLDSVTEQLIEADRSLQNLVAEKGEIDVQLQFTSDRMVDTAASISLFTDTASNTVYENAKTRIFDLQMERSQLKGKYHDNSERVTQLLSEINELEQFVNSQQQFTTKSERRGRNPAYDRLVSQQLELQNRVGAIAGRQKSLQTLTDSLQAKRAELIAVRTEYDNKQTAVDILKERQLSYLEEVDQARLANDINNSVRSGARILQGASLPVNKAGITGLARIKLAAIIGLLLGIGFLMAGSLLRALTQASVSEEESSSDNKLSTKPVPKMAGSTTDITPRKDPEFVYIGDVPVLGKIKKAQVS